MRLLTLCTLVFGVLSRCPYSGLWLKYGPKKAAEILDKRHSAHKGTFRKLEEDNGLPNMGYGTCVYTNPFSSSVDCVQFSGSGFSDASAKALCDASMGGMAVGVLAKGTRCFASTNPQLAGHCYTTEGAMEQAMPMLLGGMMTTCDAVAEACATWSRGRFVKGGACATGAPAGAPAAPPEDKPTTYPAAAAEPKPSCTIAPGPMGAAHIHANSEGYPQNCPDAPARKSPYQIPSKWKADHHMISLPFDQTKTGYSSTGTVYYDFDRNYKRADTFNTTGEIPFGFNGPADDRTGIDYSTMLHRKDKMYFINYYKDGRPPKCTYLDMIVGNVRPDWFMDGRGAATSVQFLGNQHIYHDGKPMLVKQWRKKDFADMYFTMSVMSDESQEGVHWPIQLNVPGEGFGDDGLQSYYNHQLLADDEDDVFFPDRGLDCRNHYEEHPEMNNGPPDLGGEEIPSKLNVDEAGWFELEYTASPEGPSLERAIFAQKNAGRGSMPEKAATPGVVDLEGNGQVHVCKQDSGELAVNAKFTSAENVWTAIGVRPYAACRMVPAKVNVAHSHGDEWAVHNGELSNKMRSGDATSFLDGATVADGVTVTREGSTTQMSFSEPAPADGKLHLSYAIGNSPKMSYHQKRGCVTVENIPACSDMKIGEDAAVARRQVISSDSGDCQGNFDGLKDQISQLSSQLEDMSKPQAQCTQFKAVKKCLKWNLFCKWNSASKKCVNL